MTVKMKRLVPIICITAALLAAGCEETPAGGGGSKGPEELTNLKITASVSTWGTESPLERDDRVGLYASAPFNVDNLMLTVGDAMSLIPSRDLIWQADSTVSSVTFVAYAPYSASYSGRYVTFSARQDQTSESGVKASDLMMAKADVRPMSASVNLSFAHKMVRIGLYFDNRSGKEIAGVRFDNAVLAVMADMDRCAVWQDSLVSVPERVNLAQYTDGSGKVYYAAIVAPQTEMFTGMVTFADGSSQPLQLSQYRTFDSGQQWDNRSDPIVLEADRPQDDTDMPAQFDVSISDWADGDQLSFTR